MSLDVFKNVSSSDCMEQPFTISPTYRNQVYTSHKSVYQDISVIRTLSQANSSVHLVRSNINRRTYAMKVFSHQDERPTIHYINETRFACFQHSNIIRSLHFEEKRLAKFNGTTQNISYMIMEHAEHGDLHQLMLLNPAKFDETLVRTYFQQLINGLEYLHNNKVSHLDIKLDNLLVDSDYNLKITDFDVACFSEDALLLSKGTKLYRAPEIRLGKCGDSRAADIYSAAIVLFILKTQGVYPHLEDGVCKGIDFQNLLENDVPQFWNEHRRIQKRGKQFFDDGLCDLFIGMTREDTEKRMTLEQIKQSSWYNGPVYSAEELKKTFKEC